ncbi:carboxylesterase/lipase family protein [Halopseudomonas bauzanensis]|uniref:Carboxylic ester hydrolase n=1 Tax=Halopseudomonas bauzanensis TaxID=653930 RepID=A0A1H9QCM8_9GAMM|nr:carboxylesterase family protein [Halopseudomonas bauzanensis]SER57639.1 para-nitrobenzyl esterase [Halopseudomonas bauzanensis]SFL67663.1 para-nitrobenzyl esterase [Halopseudomonas bauzanensis]
MYLNNRGVRPRSVFLTVSFTALLLPLSGCFNGSSGSDDEPRSLTGVFVDSAVAGLDYHGERTAASITDAQGQFTYLQGETISFAIGDLALGSAVGAEMLTPLSITEGASAPTDQSVVNKLILLQTLDADGNLNNGIQISDAIRGEVSLEAATIEFDQPASDFRTSLEPLLARLEEAGAFSDTDPRPRTVVAVDEALEHFARSTAERHVVDTTSGQLRGFEADANTWQFLGIPYAKPPLGDLRWRAPQPVESWEGIREAVAWSDQAAQNPGLERFGEGGMSEDSLYLNVTAPKDASELPVMVWFHGGGFTSLTGNTKPFNNPEAVASKGVVQVAVNQRLGPFGYIAHPQLSAESGYNGSGNYGQMDLIAALEWVQDNIEAFGGDPNNVTIFGESGGGRKVLSLMASPEAAGLFHRAISQSGTLYPDTRSLAAAEAIGSELQTRLGAASLEEMRSKSWLEVVSAAATLVPYTNVDNHYLPHTERVSFESGVQNDVPFMFVINTNDTIDPINTVIDVFPWMAPLNTSPVFATLFSHQPRGWREQGVEAYHGAELAYMFNMRGSVITHYQLGLVIDPATGESLVIGDLNGNGVTGSQGDAADIYASAGFDATDDEVIERMLTIWTNFAKTGDPSIPGELDYPLYDGQTQRYVELSDQAEVKLRIADVFAE